MSLSLTIRPVGAQVPRLDSDLCAPYLCISFTPITVPLPQPAHSHPLCTKFLLKTTDLNSCSGKTHSPNLILTRSLSFHSTVSLSAENETVSRETHHAHDSGDCGNLGIHFRVSGRTPPSSLRKISPKAWNGVYISGQREPQPCRSEVCPQGGSKVQKFYGEALNHFITPSLLPRGL